MTSLQTIQKEVEKIKDQVKLKPKEYIYLTYWHPPTIDETGLDIVKREGDWLTVRVECK